MLLTVERSYVWGSVAPVGMRDQGPPRNGRPRQLTMTIEAASVLVPVVRWLSALDESQRARVSRNGGE